MKCNLDDEKIKALEGIMQRDIKRALGTLERNDFDLFKTQYEDIKMLDLDSHEGNRELEYFSLKIDKQLNSWIFE